MASVRGARAIRGRRTTSSLAALLAGLPALCGADWTGTYEGRLEADAYRVTLTQDGASLHADSFSVALEDQAPCRLRADRCEATLAPDARSFSAHSCSVRLEGHADGCAGALAFELRASEDGSQAGFVSAIVIETTLNDLPIALQRVPTQCSDGIDNDSDGSIDHPTDLQCSDGHDDREASLWACGLGAELGLVVPAVAWRYRRRAARGGRL